MKITKAIPEHAPTYAGNYFKYVIGQDDLVHSLENQLTDFSTFLEQIPREKWDYRYEEGKWTIKGVVSHIIDTEMIFQYRVLRASRHDATEMEGFDENAYEQQANLDERTPQMLLQHFEMARRLSLSMFKGMNADNLDFVATANGQPFSARSGGWLMVGHVMHHMKVIQERYL